MTLMILHYWSAKALQLILYCVSTVWNPTQCWPLITQTTDNADASDHVGSAKAIAAGLVAGHTRENPGYWLHTGGTGILTFEDSDSGEFGPSDKVYDDWDGVEELLNLPDHAFHRNVDQIVLDAAAKYADVLKVALVCPPTIYGLSLALSARKKTCAENQNR